MGRKFLLDFKKIINITEVKDIASKEKGINTKKKYQAL